MNGGDFTRWVSAWLIQSFPSVNSYDVRKTYIAKHFSHQAFMWQIYLVHIYPFLSDGCLRHVPSRKSSMRCCTARSTPLHNSSFSEPHLRKAQASRNPSTPLEKKSFLKKKRWIALRTFLRDTNLGECYWLFALPATSVESSAAL